MFRLEATRHLVPPPPVSSAAWLPAHITMPPGTETAGQPFSLALYPHVDGPLAAFDDPRIRTIVLQWGTRLGKTVTALCLAAKTAATAPRNMMFASSTKDSAKRVVRGRLYPLLENCDGIDVPPRGRRNTFEVALPACTIYVGWSGSVTSLADVGAWLGIANEVDKWASDESSEADPLDLFRNRLKGFPRHKLLIESTPTIEGHSRVEAALKASNQHLRWCPCPHCGAYQVLRKGSADVPGGIKWEPKADPDRAYLTAYYECAQCLGRIENHHRLAMLRRGVWCPDGCQVGLQGRIEGQPRRPCSDAAGFGPLASWYSLSESWGHFARLWVAKRHRPRELQDVVNSYLGQTWKLAKSTTTAEQLAARLAIDTRRGTVPVGASFVAVFSDVQQDTWPFWVLGFGAGETAWLVEYGTAHSWEEIAALIDAAYPHADGGQPCTPAFALIDSGHRTKEVYDFCKGRHRAGRPVLPCKGASNDLAGHKYRESALGLKRKTRRAGRQHRGQKLLLIQIDIWETTLQRALDELTPGEPGSLALCAEAAADTELLDQLLNGMVDDVIDRRGNAQLLWVKKDDHLPNDFRDCAKYGFAGRAWYLDRRRGRIPPRQPLAKESPPAGSHSSQTTGGGFIRRRAFGVGGGFIRRRQ